MSATRAVHSTSAALPVLYVAFELGWGNWKLAFSVGPGRPARIRSIPARCQNLVMSEISKAGNRLVRWMMIQLAWGWLRYQPRSKLSRWYQRRFGQGKSRVRKIGIVALARKLLIALWKYLETGEVPAGAEVVKTKKTKRIKQPA